MAKSLASILDQIERLQKEAASIQADVIGRIRKEIAKYSLTPEQLFGDINSRGAKATKATKAAKPAKKSSGPRAAKYADGAGNTWGGMGKRPDWLRQALEAGKAIEEFLVGGTKPKSSTPAGDKPAIKTRRKPAAKAKVAAKKRTAAKKLPARKPRSTPSPGAN